mgnify:CR=1 FL=1
MLTADQVTELRRRVEAALRRREPGPFKLARCADGPLARLDIRLAPHEASSPTIIVGWSLPTDRGPILACYLPGNRAGELRFRGFSAPGRRAVRAEPAQSCSLQH